MSEYPIIYRAEIAKLPDGAYTMSDGDGGLMFVEKRQEDHERMAFFLMPGVEYPIMSVSDVERRGGIVDRLVPEAKLREALEVLRQTAYLLAQGYSGDFDYVEKFGRGYCDYSKLLENVQDFLTQHVRYCMTPHRAKDER